jgi:hypothetical protein
MSSDMRECENPDIATLIRATLAFSFCSDKITAAKKNGVIIKAKVAIQRLGRNNCSK